MDPGSVGKFADVLMGHMVCTSSMKSLEESKSVAQDNPRFRTIKEDSLNNGKVEACHDFRVDASERIEASNFFVGDETKQSCLS